MFFTCGFYVSLREVIYWVVDVFICYFLYLVPNYFWIDIGVYFWGEGSPRGSFGFFDGMSSVDTVVCICLDFLMWFFFGFFLSCWEFFFSIIKGDNLVSSVGSSTINLRKKVWSESVSACWMLYGLRFFTWILFFFCIHADFRWVHWLHSPPPRSLIKGNVKQGTHLPWQIRASHSVYTLWGKGQAIWDLKVFIPKMTTHLMIEGET